MFKCLFRSNLSFVVDNNFHDGIVILSRISHCRDVFITISNH